MVSLVRKRRRQQQRIEKARAVEINDKIAKIDSALLKLGPFANDELRLALRLGWAQLMNELEDLAVEVAALS